MAGINYINEGVYSRPLKVKETIVVEQSKKTTKQYILKRIEERWIGEQYLYYTYDKDSGSIWGYDGDNWQQRLLQFNLDYKKRIDEAILYSLKQANRDNNN